MNVASFYDDTERVYKGLDKSEVTVIKDELDRIAKRLHQLHSKIESSFEVDFDDYTNLTLKDLSEKVIDYKDVLYFLLKDNE